MKKQFKIYRLPALIALSGGLLLLGCTDSDYDFDKVDYTLGFGGDEITLPGTSSTKEITLDDLLDITTSDIITTEANGDYKLFKEPDNAIAPINVNVDRITISANKSQGMSFDIDLPDIPASLQGQKIVLPYNVLGQESFQEIEIFSTPLTLKDDDLLVIMSKGVFNALRWVEIEEVLSKKNSLQTLANNIINLVNNSPMVDKDNASIIICRRK